MNDVEKHRGDLSFYRDITNLQKEEPSAEYVQALYDRAMVTEDKNLLKRLLIELSIACMSFPKSIEKDASVRKVLEILIFYENEKGDVSFSVKRSGPGQQKFYFPLVFKKYQKVFQGKTTTLFLFQSRFWGLNQTRIFRHDSYFPLH